MSLFSRLFGGGSSGGGQGPSAEPVEYKSFTIQPEPIREGSRWRIGARIEREIGGEVKVHQLIRADTLEDRETAEQESLAKAQLAIDQLGLGLFR